MDLSKFPEDLSNESTAALQKIVKLAQAELDQRGGFEGEVFTFIRKKEGKLLNKENKWIGGKVAALFEFKDKSKRTRDFMISTSVRGCKEPVEDTESKYGDMHKYRLAFDPDDDMTIVGCYME